MKNISLFLLLTSSCFIQAQPAYREGDIIKDLQFSKVLNASYSTSSLSQFKSKLTIIDFFGTWCVPCIKALPKLMAMQQKHKNDLQVILISVEEERRLQTFLKKQNNFPFPIVADQNEMITALFQPPSLPYTVVISGSGKLIAITEAAGIDDSKIATWLASTEQTGVTVLPAATKEPGTTLKTSSIMYSSNRTVKLSQEFIYAAKTGEGAAALADQLTKIDYETLKESLKTDDEKKAFWINLYNGYTQVFLKDNPDQYENRSRFFGAKQIQIAGKNFSLDDIEHGILRHSKIKWSLGHFNKLFPGKTERELRVDKVDYRIHFALNCGAKSCPPIAYYSPERLDAQLDIATKNYLTAEAVYKDEEGRVYLPAIMGWFRADFGGKKGMKNILKKHLVIPQDTEPGISFNKYDWTLFLDNYRVQNPE